jgi:hypothetical protein
LQLDSFHHGAHRHSLGLEFLLGRHDELQQHLRVFKALYPDDPSGVFLEVAALALAQRVGEADDRAKALQHVSAEARKNLKTTCRVLGELSAQHDLDALLGESARTNTPPAGSLPQLDLGTMRVPELPCMQRYREGWAAVHSLGFPRFADIASALPVVHQSWRSHPEALMPFTAAKLLEQRHPRTGGKSLVVLAHQAELFQLAADSPSFVPGLPRLAAYLAADAHFVISQSNSTNAVTARDRCLALLRRATRAENGSAGECRTYAAMALTLREYNSARSLVAKWKQRQPDDSMLCRVEIELAGASGSFGEAITLLDRLLAVNPTDAWASQQRDAVRAQIWQLAHKLEPTNQHSQISK